MTTAEPTDDVPRYTLHAVFRARESLGDDTAPRRLEAATEVEELLDRLRAKGTETRGTYDVSGFRADADLMVWWVGGSADDLQDAYRRLRRTALGRACDPVWSAMGMHRRAEFKADHGPAWLAGRPARRYVSVYPFVRSYDWYLLPASERAAMLAEHGRMGREFPEVQPNTSAGFALGDYEWVLSFESDGLHHIVDVMRHLRAAQARRHTRVEVPFFTGVRTPVADLVAGLP